jgi:hypothetical protein
MPTYKIVRFHQHGDNEVLERGLSLKAAQVHCNRNDTKGEGWFDGYEIDTEGAPTITSYSAEVRFDVVARSPEEATELANAVASKIQAANAEITSIFGENRDEVY